MKEVLFSILTGIVGRLIGRNNLVRYGNFLSRAGRLDYPNKLSNNGEAMVQKVVLDHSNSKKTTIIDCGANKGEWTDQLCKLFLSNKNVTKLDVYCFEPSLFTFKKLLTNIGNIKSRDINIHPINKALSNNDGKGLLSIVHPGAGTNSLVQIPEFHLDTEPINMVKLSTFLKEVGVSKISLLKIDTEGADPDIIKGAMELISNQHIGIIQFEYNLRWIYGGYFLRGIFEALCNNKYHLGKITPHGVQFFPKYDVELETFVEGNYIACTDEWYKKFPKVEYWKLKPL